MVAVNNKLSSPHNCHSQAYEIESRLVILPLSFLSGTFFAVGRFPEILQIASYFNPFFYLIDGFRYGFTGQAEGSLIIGLTVVVVANVVACTACFVMFQTGYKLKA